MNRPLFVALVIGLTGPLFVLRTTEAAAEGQRLCFKLFDATLFEGRPDLSAQGLERVSVLDVGRALKSSQMHDQLPDAQAIGVWLAPQPKLAQIVILDVENLPLTGDEFTVNGSLEKYRRLLGSARAAIGNRIIGYYAVPPIRDYWRATDSSTSDRFRAWQADNDRWQALANDVDAIFPSLYTFYDDETRWVKYAKANLEESRRLARGKPVYAFIWPQYHEDNKRLGHTLIPGSYWQLQLETVAKYADGAVIWGGFQSKWNESAEWWQATREFALTSDCRTPKPPASIKVESK